MNVVRVINLTNDRNLPRSGKRAINKLHLYLWLRTCGGCRLTIERESSAGPGRASASFFLIQSLGCS